MGYEARGDFGAVRGASGRGISVGKNSIRHRKACHRERKPGVEK